MKTVNEQKHGHARSLFFQTDKSQGEIAAEVGISDKTLYLWTKEGDWRRLRSASNLMPSLIIDNFYAQVQELNNEIRSREPGKRYPNLQEAEIFRKMMLTIDRSKKRATQPQYMEMFQTFISWVQPQNNDHTKLFTNYADGFLKSRSTAGFHPYDIEYEEEFPLLRGDVPQTTNVVSEQGCVPPNNDSEPEDYYTEPIEETTPIPPLTAASSAPSAGGDSSISTTVEIEQGDVVPSKELQPNQTDIATTTNVSETAQSEIIGNSENSQQQDDPQQLTPENTPDEEAKSAIITQPEISNDPRDIYRGLSSGEAYQKYLTLKKEKELSNIQEEAPEKPPEEETQLYSIGGKVFTMRINKPK